MSERVLAAHPVGAAETDAARVAARASHMMGCDVGREWIGQEAMAWEGLLEVSRRLRRAAEEVLLDGFDLTISMLGITGRLSLAPECTLRQTALAEAMGLSLSRVSRVIDLLEARELVERRTCPSDARATNVTLTGEGAKLTKRAQQALFGEVKASFFDHLQDAEVRTLASVFARLVDLPSPETRQTR